MPEAFRLLLEERARAISEVGLYIENLEGGRELRPFELQRYEGRGFFYGWLLPVRFADGVRRLHVLATESFPFSPIRVALVDAPDFLTWPHVEKDGVLCLLPKGATVSSQDPVAVLKESLADAIDLIEQSVAGRNTIDFLNEFHTYWKYKVHDKAKDAKSLLDFRNRKSRLVKLWNGAKQYVVGERSEDIERWMFNQFGRAKKKRDFIHAALLWVPELPIPDRYPKTALDALKLAQSSSDGRQLIANLIGDAEEDVALVFGSTAESGVILGGTWVPWKSPENPLKRAPDRHRRGFRKGRVPASLRVGRFFQQDVPITRFSITRVDHDWIHGRDRDLHQQQLKSSKIVIAGCGSLGSEVAAKLAKAGIGHSLFVDPEVLEYANISRHQVGASGIGKNKASLLRDKFRQEYPHLNFDSLEKDIQSCALNFESYNLIFEMTGDWSAASFLNETSKGSPDSGPVLHGWLEARASAGHAVLLSPGECLRCGFSSTGEPRFQVTQWSHSQLQVEPACGAVFQPYGNNESSFTASLIADVAIESLVKQTIVSTHRFWAGTKEKIYEAGGEWSEAWKSHPQFRDEGSLYASRSWQVDSTCSRCFGKRG